MCDSAVFPQADEAEGQGRASTRGPDPRENTPRAEVFKHALEDQELPRKIRGTAIEEDDEREEAKSVEDLQRGLAPELYDDHKDERERNDAAYHYIDVLQKRFG